MRALISAAALVGVAALSCQASAQSQSDAVPQPQTAKLDAIAKEEAALRQRVRRLELANQPTAAVAVAPPAYNWTGFYIGGDLGGAWISNTGTGIPPTFGFIPIAFNPITAEAGGTGSLIGGFHAGFDYQFASSWVAGIEGDWSWGRTKASFTQLWVDVPPAVTPPGAFTTMSSTLQWVSSVRARFGYLVEPTVMAYATGGVARAEFDYAATNSNAEPLTLYTAPVAFSSFQLGFTVGGGFEWAVTGNWLVRAEYLYYRFGGAPNIVVPAAGFPAFPSTYAWSGTNVNVARAGLSYKF